MAATAFAGIPFHKMHGLGNDFLILDTRAGAPAKPSAEFVRALGDRRRGLGFDQLVVISEGEGQADASLLVWNADGSRAEACGNGTRCVAGILLRERETESVCLHTVAGLVDCERMEDGGICVDMGIPQLDWDQIPLARAEDTRKFPSPAPVAGVAATASAVSMGNPHCVLFVEHLDGIDIHTLGPLVERDPLFPKGVNVSFAEIRSPGRIALRVWERGSGVTLACGSAACATIVAAVRLGIADRHAEIEFETGALHLDWPADDAGVRMAGPVTWVAVGEIDPSFVAAHHACGDRGDRAGHKVDLGFVAAHHG